MPVTISILGLNRLGASVGLALAPNENIVTIGHDREPEITRRGVSRGVVKRAEHNVFKAIAGADLILLALPLAEQRDTLKLIAPEVRAGGVVATLGPLLGAPLEWGAAALKANAEQYFVAAHPILNPAQLYSSDDVGLESASAELFAKGLWALAPAPDCAPEALKLVADLAELVKSKAYFMDPLEHDGLLGVTEALPALFAAALFRAAHTSGGWAEARKVADRTFATATHVLVETEAEALTHNRAAVVHYLDAALRELQTLRTAVADGNGPALHTALTALQDQRAEWLTQRARGDWEAIEHARQTTPPSALEMMGRSLLGGFLKDKDKDK